MPRAILAQDETITFRTQGGGLVSVGHAEDTSAKVPCYEADCEVCHEPSRAERTSLTKVTEWAREHAAVCTALPPGYLSADELARQSLTQASDLLAKSQDAEDPDRLVRRAEAWTRVAAVYADLAHRQP